MGELPSGELSYSDFSRLAEDPGISKYERIGFPDSYRAGFEPAIFADIAGKLTNLGKKAKTVLDIGPGCSELPHLLVDHCEKKEHKLLLVDSQQMLDHLPHKPFIERHIGPYPGANADLGVYAGKVDVILTYSVLQYIFLEGNVFDFLDFSLGLLAPGGEMMIGDIPNQSMRHRFFSSDAGQAFHKNFMGDDSQPPRGVYDPSKIDDSVVFAILARARGAGAHAYVVPQSPDLPMANRREDILIRRP